MSDEENRDEDLEIEETQGNVPAVEALSAWAEVRCYICEITLGSVSFFTHMQWHAQTITARCSDTKDKLKAYMKTLERGDEVMRDMKWTIR